MPGLCVIGHLDADCFYVSAERVRYAHLAGAAVSVLGNQGACVIAKSYEMKAAGVKTGEPIWEAIRKCPDGLYIKRDFRWYEVLSRLMLHVVGELSPKVEYYSIDEFFFEAIPPRGMDHQAYALAIRGRIMELARVTVGVARSNTLAKLISNSAKPFGVLAVFDRAVEVDLLAERPMAETPRIAKSGPSQTTHHGAIALWSMPIPVVIADEGNRASERLFSSFTETISNKNTSAASRFSTLLPGRRCRDLTLQRNLRGRRIFYLTERFGIN